MRTRSTESSTSLILLIVVMLYIGLLIVIIVFFQQILLTISSVQSFATYLGLGVIAFLPIFLLGIIIYNIVKLFYQRLHKKSGAKFKTKLLLFFALIALLSAIPQTTLSITFLNSLINSQFITQINDVFTNAWNITLEYYQAKSINLNKFGSHPILKTLSKGVDREASRVWRSIQDLNPELNYFQVLNKKGAEIFFAGEEQAKTPFILDSSLISGMLPKLERNKITLFRYLYIYEEGSEKYYLILGSSLPAEFEEKAKLLADSRELFSQLFQFKDLIQISTIIFYFYFSLPILLIVLIISFYLAEEIIRPIRNLEEATKRVAEGDFSFRILALPHDELSSLINSFNSMVAELEVAKQKLQKTEKLSAWQDIAQRLAHEIKNPLTPIKLAAERIYKKYEEFGNDQNHSFGPILETSIQAILREVGNLDNMLKEFNNFAKLPDPRFEKVKVKDLLKDIYLDYENSQPNIKLELAEPDDSLLICADSQQFKQALANLILNSFQAMPDGGNVILRADLVKKEKRNYCRIQVRDNGLGIEESDQPFIFNPYFTTKKNGTGLGLSIVEKIVFEHKGNVWFESQKGAGTTFYIDIPLEQL